MTDVTLHIDGQSVSVPKGTKVIRAAEQIGIAIPRFCDHPLLDPVAACRQCMVEVPDAGNGRGMKPQPACALDAVEGMIIKTGNTSGVARDAQQGMLEFLLINHPLDCPVCDKGGECPLQNQAMADGRGESRYDGVKRTYPKPIPLTHMLLLDRERCVLCQRCTRFGDQISGDALLSLAERGARSQIGVGPSSDTSYFAGNLAQICPVGALTTNDYRFQARPFDLVSVTTTCDGCAAGCTLRVDHRHGEVTRKLAATDLAVNEEWNCDKGRFAFRSADDALTAPLVRVDGELRPASWPTALKAAAEGLRALDGAVGVLPGGRLTVENAEAYARLAAVLGTRSIDFRTRRGATDEEAAFLAGLASAPAVSYTDLEAAPQVVLVGLEPEDECPMIFLRLRKATRRGTSVIAVAPVASAGSRKLAARVIAAAPGGEAAALATLKVDVGAVVLVGERAGEVSGLLPAAQAFAARHQAKLAWVPRRAGELGAITAGCLPGAGGLITSQMLDAAARGEIGLVIGGVDLDDLDATARQGVAGARFVVSLEQRPSAVTQLADVVLPVALLANQAGHFVSWTRQARPVSPVLKPQPMTDARVLAELAALLGQGRGASPDTQVAAIAPAPVAQPAPVRSHRGEHVAAADAPVLATHRTLLVGSRCLDGSTALRPRPATVVTGIDVITAAHLVIGTRVRVTGPGGLSVVAPLVLDTATAPGVVWLPDAPWPAGVPVTIAPEEVNP